MSVFTVLSILFFVIELSSVAWIIWIIRAVIKGRGRWNKVRIAMLLFVIFNALVDIFAFKYVRYGTSFLINAENSIAGMRVIADIPISGGGFRYDYQSLDPQSNRLYIAHLWSSSVTVFDTEGQKVVADIPDIASVHGVLAVPSLGKVFATASGSKEVIAIDNKTLHIVGRTPGGQYPDGIAYDPVDGKLFVSDEFGGKDIVIDARTNERIAEIPLGGEVGNTQYDPIEHRILAVIQTQNQLASIDPKTNVVVDKYNLPGCEHPHGLLIDAQSRLAFAACDDNAKLAVIDLKTMQVTSLQTVGEDPDVLAFDESLHRLYVAAESGVLAIFEERNSGGGIILEKITQGFVAPDAHTIAVDQKTHRVYLPLEKITGPVLRIMEPIE